MNLSRRIRKIEECVPAPREPWEVTIVRRIVERGPAGALHETGHRIVKKYRDGVLVEEQRTP